MVPSVAEHRLRRRGPRDYDGIGLAVPHFAERLSCYCVRIGMADMAYSAFKKRWEQVALKAAPTLELARGWPPASAPRAC